MNDQKKGKKDTPLFGSEMLVYCITYDIVGFL